MFWNIFFPPYFGNNHPNIFFRGRYTTNQRWYTFSQNTWCRRGLGHHLVPTQPSHQLGIVERVVSLACSNPPLHATLPILAYRFLANFSFCYLAWLGCFFVYFCNHVGTTLSKTWSFSSKAHRISSQNKASKLVCQSSDSSLFQSHTAMREELPEKAPLDWSGVYMSIACNTLFICFL